MPEQREKKEFLLKKKGRAKGEPSRAAIFSLEKSSSPGKGKGKVGRFIGEKKKARSHLGWGGSTSRAPKWGRTGGERGKKKKRENTPCPRKKEKTATPLQKNGHNGARIGGKARGSNPTRRAMSTALKKGGTPHGRKKKNFAADATGIRGDCDRRRKEKRTAPCRGKRKKKACCTLEEAKEKRARSINLKRPRRGGEKKGDWSLQEES